MAEECDVGGGVSKFAVGERAADVCGDSEQVEQIAHHQLCCDFLRLARAGEHGTRVGKADEILENRRALPPAEVVGRSHDVRTARAASVRFPHDDQAIGILEWQPLDQRRVYKGENRCVRPDSQRQCEHGDRGERRGPRERTDRVADVLPERIHAAIRRTSRRFG